MYIGVLPAFIYLKASDLLKLEPQAVVSGHTDAGN